jgi:colicin import membrane protein
MLASVGLASFGLLVPSVQHPAAMVQYAARPQAAAFATESSLPSALFPPTTSLLATEASTGLSFDDLLEREAAVQAKKDAEIEAKKAILRKRVEEQEAADAAKYAEAQKLLEQRQEKAAAAKAAAKARAEAEEAARAAAREAIVTKSGAPSSAAAKANKYGSVQKINKQQQRIDERVVKGEDAPYANYLGQ